MKDDTAGHQEDPSGIDDIMTVVSFCTIAGVIGVFTVILACMRGANGFAPALSAVGASLLAAGASAFVGGLAGFLFAIPRSRQGDSPAPTVPGDGTIRLRDYAANTNLEQVSDWLTKILIGVGLVEAQSVTGHLRASAVWYAGSFPSSGMSPGVKGESGDGGFSTP